MINPIAFHFLGFPVRWYGIAYFSTFLLSFQIAKNHAKYANLTKKDLEKLLNFTVLGVIFGGRIGEFLFYEKFSYKIFYIWEGGMSFHGGVLGVICSTLLFCKIHKKDKWAIGDLIAINVPIGCFLGRIANYINNEIHGTSIKCQFLAKIFEKFGISNYPVVFLEAFLEGIVLWTILWLGRKKNLQIPGKTSAIFLIFYGIFRIISEFFRRPDGIININNFLTISYGQLLSIPMIFLGIYILYNTKKAAKIES